MGSVVPPAKADGQAAYMFLRSHVEDEIPGRRFQAKACLALRHQPVAGRPMEVGPQTVHGQLDLDLWWRRPLVERQISAGIAGGIFDGHRGLSRKERKPKAA